MWSIFEIFRCLWKPRFSFVVILIENLTFSKVQIPIYFVRLRLESSLYNFILGCP
jgi:hypothetical protein